MGNDAPGQANVDELGLDANLVREPMGRSVALCERFKRSEDRRPERNEEAKRRRRERRDLPEGETPESHGG